MNGKKTCPECGATLPADAPEGLCPQCLVKGGLGASEAATESATEIANRKSQIANPAAPPTLAELAPHFPQLEILELIGQGGMGIVYKARQPHLDRFVALKILMPEIGRDPTFAERFAREAKALARLNHPNIVGVYDFGQAGGFYYFLMEFVDGVNLRQLEQSRRLTPQEALSIVPKICDALQYSHDEGIVHRDIKPGNILLDKRGRVKIADFGLAKLVGKAPADLTLTHSHQVMGTPHYMAPEQMEKPQTVDHRADIYSLGVVFYEMLTGELPMGRFAPPSQKVQVDVRVDEVVLHSLERDVERRYQHVSEVKTDVETIAASGKTAGTLSVVPPAADAPLSSPRPPEPKPGAERSSLPFTIPEGHRWFGETKGLLRLEPDELVIEFEVKSVLPFARLSPREVRVPYADLASVSLDTEMVYADLTLRVSKLALLAGVPTSEGGQVTLDAADFDSPGDVAGQAKRFVAHLRHQAFGEPLPEQMVAGTGETVAAQPAAAGPAVPSPTVSESGPPPFSRKAIVGAAWAFFVVPAASMINPIRNLAEGQTALQTLFAFIFILPGVTAPFGTTILGLLALRDIRQSCGRIGGLGLALTDAVLFPLLVLDGAICLLCVGGSRYAGLALSLHPLNPVFNFVMLCAIVLSVLACVGVDFLIVRAASRAAKKAGAAPPAVPPTQPPTPIESGIPRDRALQEVKGPAIGLLATGVLNWIS